MALPQSRTVARLAAAAVFGSLSFAAPAVLAASSAAGDIQPHKAVYKMSLLSARRWIPSSPMSVTVRPSTVECWTSSNMTPFCPLRTVNPSSRQ